jgi:hypothetical protein
MTFSKLLAMKNTAVMTGLVASLLLSACLPKTQDRPDGTENEAANYTVVSISGSIGGSKNVGEFPLPGEKTYNFKVCLVDYTRRSSIPNAKFLIKEIDKEYTTDAQGCLNWPETIKFNYLADSVWLKMTRTFEPQGLQRGIQAAKFAINPWSHGEGLADVVDLMKETKLYLLEDATAVSKHLGGYDKDGKLKTRKIWLEGGERYVTNFIVKGGSTYNWHDQLHLNPQILFGKTDSTPTLVAITQGSFNVEVSLIAEDIQNQKVVRKLYAKQSKEKVAMTNNTLMVDMNFSLDKIPTSGQTFMGIKLTPVGAPEGLLPFEGIFPLGNDHSFTQSTGLKVSETVATENRTGNFTLKNFLGDKAAVEIVGLQGVNGQIGDGSSNDESAGIYAKPLEKIGHFKIKKENGAKKVLSFPVHTCLSSRSGNIGLNNRKFKIQTTGPDGQVLDVEQPNIVTTTKENCLHWEVYTPEFDRNSCQHYIAISVRIQDQSGDLGFDKTESLLIQPWSEEVYDRRTIQDKSYSLTCKGSEDKGKVDNVMFMASLTMQRISYRPQVLDRSLQLTQRGVYQIRVNGASVRDSSDPHAGSEGVSRNLPKGKYLLRLVFVRSANNRADNGYVTHANVIVSGEGGFLDGEMDLTIKDLQSTLARKMVLAQLFPIDSEKLASKEWKNTDPNIEDLIDRKSILISPVYSAKTVVLGSSSSSILLYRGVDQISDVPGVAKKITDGPKKSETQTSTLLDEVIQAGQAAQAAMIAKQAFKEQDADAWFKWSREQNLQLIWMSDAKSLQYVQQKFGLQGDAKATLQNFIEMDKMDLNWAKQFCRILADGSWKTLLETAPKHLTTGSARSAFIRICESKVEKNPSAFMQKSAVYRVLSMNPGVVVPQKIAVSSLSVSSGFGYSAGHTEMEGTQSGISVSGQGGVSAGFAGASLGASYGTVVIQTTDRNRHSGTDIGEGTSLGVTRWQFDIPMTRYNQCTMVRPNPDVFLFDKEVGVKSILPRMLTDNETYRLRDLVDTRYLYKPYLAHNPLFNGWLICSDKVSTQPKTVPETYFMVSQGNGDSETYDSLDELNRLFFMPLRGLSDMARFKGVLGQSRNYPQDGELSDQMKVDLAAEISPLIRRIDPAPGMILYDPAFQLPKLSSE